MAGFKAHFTTGLTVGAVGAFMGISQGIFGITSAVGVVAIGGIGGILPDLDSDSGTPLNFLFETLGILVPVSLLPWAQANLGNTALDMIAFIVIGYIATRYLLCEVVKKITVHRGNLHSIPFGIICWEVAWLSFSSNTPFEGHFTESPAFIASLILFAGFLSHLVLDELNSFHFKWGIIPAVKNSSGTALKLVGSGVLATLLLYGTAIAFVFPILAQ
jgi:hypothetical protein